jgi:hypothetical protein
MRALHAVSCTVFTLIHAGSDSTPETAHQWRMPHLPEVNSVELNSRRGKWRQYGMPADLYHAPLGRFWGPISHTHTWVRGPRTPRNEQVREKDDAGHCGRWKICVALDSQPRSMRLQLRSQRPLHSRVAQGDLLFSCQQ